MPKHLKIPNIDDTYLMDIEDIMNGRPSDPRLVEEPFDFAWRHLTLFSKHPSHSPESLGGYQRYALSKFKGADPQERSSELHHLLYSLNYRSLLQLSPEELGVVERMHIGIVLYSAQTIERKVFVELVKEYIGTVDILAIAVDYCLLLEDQQVLEVLAWYLVEKGRVEEYFGMEREYFQF